MPGRARFFTETFVNERMPAIVPISPSYVQVEIVNRCNLRCVMCPIEELTKSRKRKVLDEAGFAAIASQFPALKRVDLQGIGEPTLNPHLEEIISWCRRRGLEVGFVTNGLLFDEARIESVLRANPSRIVFSVDSVDPQIFASIRPRGDVARLLENIRTMVEKRRELGLRSPAIGIMAVAMKTNLPALPAVIEAAAELGIDGLTIKGLNTTSSNALQLAEPQPEEYLIRVKDGV
jgi:MoaA/NifB/PqqE/SkfB family radical SAM enzyme